MTPVSYTHLDVYKRQVFGIPIGVLISDAFGWRAAFGVLSVVAFAKALLLLLAFPSTRIRAESVKLVTQLRILRNPIVVGHVLLSLLVFTGMFTAYTYLADMLERLAGFNGQIVGWTMMAFGAVGLIGNTLGGRMVDRSPLGATAPVSYTHLDVYKRQGLRRQYRQPSTTSWRLWGGMLVAMPTAMPELPLTSRFGRREGSSSGSCSLPS